MLSLRLPTALQQRILKYHNYLAAHHNQAAYRALFTQLSLNLIVELKLFLFRQLINEAPFFEDISPVPPAVFVLLCLLLSIHPACCTSGGYLALEMLVASKNAKHSFKVMINQLVLSFEQIASQRTVAELASQRALVCSKSGICAHLTHRGVVRAMRSVWG